MIEYAGPKLRILRGHRVAGRRFIARSGGCIALTAPFPRRDSPLAAGARQSRCGESPGAGRRDCRGRPGGAAAGAAPCPRRPVTVRCAGSPAPSPAATAHHDTHEPPPHRPHRRLVHRVPRRRHAQPRPDREPCRAARAQRRDRRVRVRFHRRRGEHDDTGANGLPAALAGRRARRVEGARARRPQQPGRRAGAGRARAEGRRRRHRDGRPQRAAAGDSRGPGRLVRGGRGPRPGHALLLLSHPGADPRPARHGPVHGAGGRADPDLRRAQVHRREPDGIRQLRRVRRRPLQPALRPRRDPAGGSRHRRARSDRQHLQLQRAGLQPRDRRVRARRHAGGDAGDDPRARMRADPGGLRRRPGGQGDAQALRRRLRADAPASTHAIA